MVYNSRLKGYKKVYLIFLFSFFALLILAAVGGFLINKRDCGIGPFHKELPYEMALYWYSDMSGMNLQLLDKAGYPILQKETKLFDNESFIGSVKSIEGYVLKEEFMYLFLILDSGRNIWVQPLKDSGSGKVKIKNLSNFDAEDAPLHNLSQDYCF